MLEEDLFPLECVFFTLYAFRMGRRHPSTSTTPSEDAEDSRGDGGRRGVEDENLYCGLEMNSFERCQTVQLKATHHNLLKLKVGSSCAVRVSFVQISVSGWKFLKDKVTRKMVDCCGAIKCV